MDVAVLLLIWRRPSHVKKVINSLRIVSPKKIYISSDGPIKDNLKNKELVEATREIVLKEINWDCEKILNFSHENKGCRIGVSEGIDWFFSYEEEGIILEDDCVPNEDFFYFCQNLLKKYRNNDNIWAICGNGYQDNKSKNSYFFSRYLDVWGWATWRRCWNSYDKDIKSWKQNKYSSKLKNVFENTRELKYWNKIFDDLYYKGIPDTWDYQFQYQIFINSGMTCMPYINSVQNIGFGEGATHTTHILITPNNSINNVGKIKFPLIHPDKIIRSRRCDFKLQNIFYSGYPLISFNGIKVILKKIFFKLGKSLYFKKYLNFIKTK